MKFCNKCGAQLEDNAKFCAKCGNQMEEVQTPVEENPQSTVQPDNGAGYIPGTNVPLGQPPKSFGTKIKEFFQSLATNKNRLIGFIVTCVLAIVAVWLIVSLVGCVFGGGYEKPIKNLCSGLEKGDADKIMDALPFDGIEEAMEKMGLSMDMFTDELEDGLDDLKMDSVDYKVKKKNKIDEDDYSENISSTFKMFIETDDIDGMYELDLELTVKMDGEKNTEDVNVVVAKIDGNWKIVGGEFLDILDL